MPAGPHHREGSVGTDFIAFYTAGVFVRDGRSRSLYDLHAIAEYQHALAHQNGDDLGQAIGPWWNPPYYAWLFVPLAKFAYPTALRLWLACDLLCAALAVTILSSWVKRASLAHGRASATSLLPSPGTPGEDQGGGLTGDVDPEFCIMPAPTPAFPRSSGRGGQMAYSSAAAWGLVPVLIALSTPFIQSLTHAQNTCTSLLLLTLVVAAWRKEMPFVAGLLLGSLAYKPQLVTLVAVIMTICIGWRVLLGLAVSGAVLLAVNLLTLPGTLGDYQRRLPINLHFVLMDVPYLWDRHVTFRAFWRLLFQGYAVGEASVMTWIATSMCSICLGRVPLFRGAANASRAGTPDPQWQAI